MSANLSEPPFSTSSRLTFNDTPEESEGIFPYRKLVGALMYIAVGTRLNIAHAVNALSPFNSRPEKAHWTAAKRVLRYLQDTLNQELVFRKDDLPLREFMDADWGNCPIDRRSFTGFTFILSGAAVTWESRKQWTVTLISMNSHQPRPNAWP